MSVRWRGGNNKIFTNHSFILLTLSITAYFVEFADAIRPHLTTAKLAVTGGFRSTKGMASALRGHSCDIIGLGRPLTAEPELTKALIEGKSSVAKGNKVPEPMQTGSAIMQLHGKFRP